MLPLRTTKYGGDMSRNKSTYLKYNVDLITADSTSERLSATDKFVYGMIIGVQADSASATTGNYVSDVTGVTVAAGDGVKITADSPFSVSAYNVGNELLAVNLADYYVATTSGDKIFVAYLEETAI